MSTSLAISSAALAQSSAAMAAAQRAEHVARCTSIMQRPDLTTTIGRQTYAACVAYMEPVPSADNTPQHVKVTIGALVLIVLITGFINAWRNRHDGYGAPVLNFVMEWFMGCIFAGVVIGIGLGLIALAAWIF